MRYSTNSLFIILILISNHLLAGYGPFETGSRLTFLQNRGQWNTEVLYQGKSGTTNVYLTRTGLSFSQIDNRDEKKLLVWNMSYVNSNPSVLVQGLDGKESVTTFMNGKNRSDWVIRPMEYNKIRYKEIYKNTDLEFYGNEKQLKYDYIIRPGGDVGLIKASYSGVTRMLVNDKGDLEIFTPWHVQVQKAPVSWQEINGVRIPVDVDYVLLNDSTFGFNASNGYDRNYELVIDPLFEMVWASYTQATGISNNINYCFANAMDRDGNVFLTGMVDSTFPVTPGAYSGPGNVQPEIFVAKFSKDGTTMLYSTYLPANSSEHGTAIAVDDEGKAYVTGVIDLNITGITDYPSTANAYQPVHNDGSDAFLTVLDSTGSNLVYSTFLGEDGGETGYGVVLGPTNIAYLVGTTTSANFPVVNSAVYPAGDNMAFVAKFDVSQSGAASLLYSTKIGAGNFNSVFGRGIAVNAAGNVFITGTILNNFGSVNFPLTPGAYNSTYNGGSDNAMAYAIKFSATTPLTIEYATFLGPGEGNAAALTSGSDEVYIAGSTRTFTFPVTTGALQTTHGQDALGNPNSDAYVLKLNSTGSALIYSTFLGGRYSEGASGLAVNSAGEAYVAGIAQDSFPTSSGAIQTQNAGSYDFFIVHLSADGTAYGCGGSTYVGGSDADYTGSFYDYPSPKVTLLDHGGVNDTISISSTSHSQDFPTTPGVYGPVKVNSIADQPVFFKLTCQVTSGPPVAGFTQQDSTSCNSVSIDFQDNSTGNPTSWQWTFQGGTPGTSSQENPQDIIYTTSGTYQVDLVACNSLGCDSISQQIQVLVPQDIPVDLGNDTTICDGQSVTLSANPGLLNYEWFLNGVPTGTGQPELTVSQAGTYIVVVNDSLGCSGTDTIAVNIGIVSLALGPDIIMCSGDSVQLSATGGFATYQWTFNSSVLPQIDSAVFVQQAGIYTVEATDTLGCVGRDTVSVGFSIPQVSLGADVIICGNDSVLLHATPGLVSYQWTHNGNFLSSTADSLYVQTQGTYIVTATDSIGCTASDTLNVNINTPQVSLGADVILCENDSVLLNATSGFVQYLWSYNGTLLPQTDSLIYIFQQGSYIVTVTDSTGCNDADTLQATLATVALTLMNDTAFCAGDSITITAPGGFSSYQWLLNGSGISNNTTITATQNGNYVLEVTNPAGCVARDSVNVTVRPLPQIQTINDITICAGSSVTLSTTGGTVYNWSPSTYLSSPTSANPVSTPENNLSYIVTGSDINGCLNSDTVSIQLSPRPEAQFEYSLSYGCAGVTVITQNKSVLATSYTWIFSDGTISNEFNVTHTFNNLQSQSIQLVASNGICNDSTAIQQVNVALPGIADIPNVITPNGDNRNDCFRVKDITIFTGCYDLKIFNRWGNKVFETNDTGKCWNGTDDDGNELPAGVYYYLITIKDLKKEGPVHLMR